MPQKPPAPPSQPPRAAAPHVQAAVARAAQAKLPERPPLPARPLQPAASLPTQSRLPAHHVREAMSAVQTKLSIPAGARPRPAPPLRASPSTHGNGRHVPRQATLQCALWKFNATEGKWGSVENKETAESKYRLPGPRHSCRLQNEDVFNDVTGELTRQDGTKLSPRQLGLSPTATASASLNSDSAAGSGGSSSASTPIRTAKKEKSRDEKAQEAAQKEEARKKAAKAKLPSNAKEALNYYLKRNTGTLVSGMKTICALFLSGKGCVIGRSGGPNTKIWERTTDGGVTVKSTESAATRSALADFAGTLSTVEKKITNREVWDCAEVDAAVKAILKGWTNYTKFTFWCAEWPGDKPRYIDACQHCSQWAS